MSAILFYFVIGIIVSMDVMALTIGKSSTYSNTPKQLVKWAALNAIWHAALLAFYVFVFHLLVTYSRGLLDAIDLSWIQFHLPQFVADKIIWLVRKLQIHLFSIFATATIILVWLTYSSKIIDRPLAPDANSLPRWMRLAFVPLQRVLASETFNLNLQAAIVAVDMLALAALIKATEKNADAGEKVIMTLIVGLSVFSLTLGAAFLARHKMGASAPPSGAADEPTEISKTLARLWILVTLRLMEPLLIFYFLLQLLAHMSTGMHIDSPALLLAAALMVVAIVQRHSLAKILDAVRTTEKAPGT